jgi:site-specific DNA-cytosine methylase
MKTEYGIIDLFAGPGGLAEGFASIRNSDGSRPFRLALSVEKERAAYATLRLRSFIRQFDHALPPEYFILADGLACAGDARSCLKRNEAWVAREKQFAARQNVLDATPANTGAPERLARQAMPGGLYG